MADNVADDAVDAILAEQGLSTDLDQSAMVGAVLDADDQMPAPVEPDVDLCDEAEARQLVEQVRRSISTLNDCMTRIIKGQAWAALGYPTIDDFFVSEFSGDTASGGLGVSNSHLQRLAKVLIFYYGLHQRIGDSAFELDFAERAIRSLPGGRRDRAGLDMVIDEVAAAVTELGPDASKEQLQEAAERAVEAVRKPPADVARPEATEQDLADGLAMFGITSMSPDHDPFHDDVDSGDDLDGDSGASRGGGGGSDGWRDEYDQREGLSLPSNFAPAASADGVQFTILVANLNRSITMLREVAAAPTDAVLERMSSAEVAALAEGADDMIAVLTTMRDWASSDDAPIDLSD